MDVFGTIIAVAIVVGFTSFLIYRQREKDRKSNPLGPFVLRATASWNESAADRRNLLLMNAGVDSESKRNFMIVRSWNTLDGDVQIALTKLQMISESAASSSVAPSHLGKAPIRGQDRLADKSAEAAVVGRNSGTPALQTEPYFDAFLELAKKLSRDLSLSEWETGIPQSYTAEESQSIEATKQDRSRLAYTTASRFVEEPLQRLLTEIGLVNWAREDLTTSYDEWGPDLPLENLESITSSFLKAWLCNSNPFVLLELADFLAENGRSSESGDVLKVASKFPAYAQTMEMSEMELVAESIASELIPPGPGREARSLSRGLYSPRSLSILSNEAIRIQKKLDELDQSPREDTTPSHEQVKELWEAWEQDPENGILRVFEKRRNESL